MPRSFVEQASARCSVEGAGCGSAAIPRGRTTGSTGSGCAGPRRKGALSPLHDGGQSVAEREVRARYESMYSGIFYRRFVLGEWTAAEGRIYDFYAPGGVRAGGARGAVGELRVSWTTGQ